jgi:hypothetical protein
MVNPGQWKLRLLTAVSAVALAAIAAFGSGCADEEVVSVECQSTRDYYAANVHPITSNICAGCHNTGGLAKDTEYILENSAISGFLDHNLETIRRVASLELNGESIWLLKPTLQVPHEGGMAIEKGSDNYKKMVGLVVRLKNDNACQPNDNAAFQGVEMLSAIRTLRKAAIMLVGRLPTTEENQRVTDGGFPALEAVLDEMMTEPAFYDLLRITYNDLFLTDFYITQGTDFVSGDYADPMWYETAGQSVLAQYGLSDVEELQRFINISIAREPLALIDWVVKNDLPFSEILTANYTMVTPLSQRSLGATLLEGVQFDNPNDPLEFKPAIVPGRPHAGVLTTFAFLQRHDTTPTNRNRARGRKVHLWFLATDILALTKEPIDQKNVSVQNPTVNDGKCSLCHQVNEPVGNLFAAFGLDRQECDDGVEDCNDLADNVENPSRYYPGVIWYDEMWAPGYKDELIDTAELPNGVPWLAQRVVRDERFAQAAVRNAFTGLIGRTPMVAPEDFTDPMHEHKFKAFVAQSNTLSDIAAKFIENGMNMKTVYKELILSPYFRAVQAVPGMTPEQQAALDQVGTGRLLPPEMLHRKIIAISGLPWGSYDQPNLDSPPRDPGQTGQFQLFFGGIDSVDATTRITEANGVIAAGVDLMSIEMAVQAVATDFARAATDHLMFPNVTVNGEELEVRNVAPETDAGLPVPQAEAAIKQAIVHLHDHFLGEKLTADDPEVDATYQLFVQTWREYNDKIDSGEIGEGTLYEVTTDPITGETLPEDQQVTSDPKGIIRSWTAVVAYLMADMKFMYEL